MNVTFRSDRDPDFACLEQYLVGGEFGNLPDTWLHQAAHDLAVLQKHVDSFANTVPWITDEMRLELRKFDEVDLPTRYDSPIPFRILDGLVKRIRAAADNLGLKAHTFPHHACIPTGLVNACAVELPCSSRPFILFDSALFLYCHLFAKSFACCLPVVGREETLSFSVDKELVQERIEGMPELVSRLNDLLTAYVVTGSPSRAKQFTPEADYVHLIDILRDGMELFVVAHEFGHVYSGHLSDILKRANLHENDLFGNNLSHRHEHEADIVGLLLTLQAMATSGYDASLSYVGIELFFVSLEMAGRTAHINSHGNDDTYVDVATNSHPSNARRRFVLSAFLQAFIRSEEQVQSVREMAAKYADIAELLWQFARSANPSFQWNASGGH
jgi:hypothetical protein